MYRRKARTNVLFSGTGYQDTYSGGVRISHIAYPYSISESQQTWSDGHPFRKSKRRPRIHTPKKIQIDDLRDTGGNFLSYKKQVFPQRKIWHLYNSKTAFTRYTYDGPLTAFLGLNPSMGLDLPLVSDSQLDAWGTICISRVLPTNPVAGIGQFLGELRELPKLPGLALLKARAKKVAYSKALSSEFLNYQFGWLPFAKDLVSLADTISKKDAIIAQYERDSGRLVRRKTVLFDTVSTTNTVLSTNAYPSPAGPTPMYTHSGTLTKTVTTSHRVWFSGAFTYHFESGVKPPSSGKHGRHFSFYRKGGETPELMAKRRRQMLSKLYGLRLDPYLLYQLYPWSWLADWFTNLGSIVKNLVAFHNDGLVMRYGYIMSYQRETTVYTLSNLGLYGQGEVVITDVLVKHCKQRRRATPFGFGLQPSAFSLRQWSILAALGISRAPKSLSF